MLKGKCTLHLHTSRTHDLQLLSAAAQVLVSLHPCIHSPVKRRTATPTIKKYWLKSSPNVTSIPEEVITGCSEANLITPATIANAALGFENTTTAIASSSPGKITYRFAKRRRRGTRRYRLTDTTSVISGCCKRAPKTVAGVGICSVGIGRDGTASVGNYTDGNIPSATATTSLWTWSSLSPTSHALYGCANGGGAAGTKVELKLHSRLPTALHLNDLPALAG